MKQHNSPLSWIRNIFPFLAAVGLIFTTYQGSIAQFSIQPVRWDLPVTVPSPRESSSWFPNIAVDTGGNVHFVWSETYTTPDGEQESIYYSSWNGNQWSQYIDIVSPAPDIRRNSLTIDQNDTLHLTYIDSRANDPYQLGYSSANSSRAFSAGNWSPIIYLNDRGQSYFNEIVSIGDSLHVVYEDSSSEGKADMFYRRSLDRGLNWDRPMNLFPTPGGSSRPHITFDDNGELYIAWDEGWDRLSGTGLPEYGMFTVSKDLGQTWAEPMEIRYPNNTNAQFTVEVDGKGGIMIVWRTVSAAYPGIYFMWSNDNGITWSQPGTLPSFNARPMINYFDSFDMARDSSGHIHLIASGFLVSSEERIGDTPGLYHFEWDGLRWYPPTQVYNGGLIPEYPRVVVERGNVLHTSWFVRYDAFLSDKSHEIMYARGISAAAQIEPEFASQEAPPQMISQVEDARPVAATDIPNNPPRSTLEPAPFVSSESLYSEADEMEIIMIGLVPAVLIIWASILIVRRRQRL